MVRKTKLNYHDIKGGSMTQSVKPSPTREPSPGLPEAKGASIPKGGPVVPKGSPPQPSK